MNRLQRFLDEQEFWYFKALAEVRSGKKLNHWMWFIFPQLPLGQTPTSLLYSIKSREEALEYLGDPILGFRLQEISEAVLELNTNSTTEIFGPIDALKLRSCMTLFASISSQKGNVFQMVLMKFYSGERCERTLELLG